MNAYPFTYTHALTSFPHVLLLPCIVANPSSAVHDAAVKKAADATGLVAFTAVAAKAFVKSGITLPAVHTGWTLTQSSTCPTVGG